MSGGDEPVGDAPGRLSILRLVKDAQQKHGLRQGNYLRYRGYCGRRIRRLRKSLKFTHQHKSFPKRAAKFTLRPVTVETVSEARFLEILVFETERNWAYAMHLKVEIGDDLHDRRKHHMRQRLRRAAKCSAVLKSIAQNCEIIDVSTKMEAQAYSAFMKASLCVEFKYWKKALGLLNTARKIYQRFRDVHQETNIYVTRCQEIDNLIRLCRFHSGEMDTTDFTNETAVEEMLDLDFNKLSVEQKVEKKEEAPVVVKFLEAMPCKPMFFDIANNYRTKQKS